jgi:hypothetical protein
MAPLLRPRHNRVLVAAKTCPLQQRTGTVVVQGEHILRAGAESDLADPAEIARRTHHHRGLGIANKVFDFTTLVGGVQRQEYMASTQCRQIQQRSLDRLFHLHCDPRSRRETQPLEQIGQHGAGAVQVAPAVEQAVVGFDCDAVEIARECLAQGLEEVSVGAGSVGHGCHCLNPAWLPMFSPRRPSA